MNAFDEWLQMGLSPQTLDVLWEGLQIGQVTAEPFLTGCRAISPGCCKEDADWDFACLMLDPPACRQKFTEEGWTYKMIHTRDRGATIYKRAPSGQMVNIIAIPIEEEWEKWRLATTSGLAAGLTTREERVEHFRVVVGDRRCSYRPARILEAEELRWLTDCDDTPDTPWEVPQEVASEPTP